MRGWEKVRLEQVLRHRKQFIQIDDLQSYKRARVRLHAQGIVLRDEVPGALIKTKKQQVCQAGEFLVAEIDAKVGGFGIVPPELDGAIVSSHYFLFQALEDRLERRFLDYYVRTRAFRDQVAAQGSTNYAAIRPADVLSYEIPLPPLQEQRRVVARLAELGALAAEAGRLHEECSKETDALARALLKRRVEGEPSPLRELIRLRSPDVVVSREVTYHFAGVYSFGRGVFRGQRKSGLEFEYPRLTRLRKGDFIYPKLMAWEGAFGVVPEECDGLVVSTEFPVFEVIPGRIVPEVLDVYFRNPEVWPQIAGASSGTNVRRRRLNPQNFLDWRIPVPSPKAQELLQVIEAHSFAIRRIREMADGDFRALMVGELNRHFQ